MAGNLWDFMSSGNDLAAKNFGTQVAANNNWLDNYVRSLAGNQNFQLGQGQLALGNKSADQNFALGQGKLGNEKFGIQKQFDLGDLTSGRQLEGLKYGQDAETGRAQIGADTSLKLGGLQFNLGDLNSQRQLEGVRVAQGGETERANIGSGTQRYLGDLQNQLGRFGQEQETGRAQIGADTQKYLGDLANKLGLTQDASNTTRAQIGADTSRYQSDNDLREAELSRLLGMYQADQGLAGTKYGADAQTEQTRIGIEPAMLNYGNQQKRFESVFPLLSQLLGESAGGGGEGGGAGGPGAGGGNQPYINQGPVYTDAMQQALINQAQSRNAIASASDGRAAAQGAGARGMGAGSPALAGDQRIRDFNRMRLDMDAQTGIPLQIAQANAAHDLSASQAAEEQYGSRQQELLEKMRIAQAGRAPLIAALSALAG